MDIFSHTVSGMAVASACLPWSTKKNRWYAPLVILTGAGGGALPDFDAISMWGGYDSTIGKWFGLEHTGRDVYFNQLWYSHHGVTHSLLGMVFFTGVFLLIMRISMRPGRRHWNWRFAVPFAAAYFMHLIEDMPTPGSVWEGIMLFCPSDHWVGGYGWIWWWSNYDIFLLFAACTVLNILLFTASRWLPVIRRYKMTIAVWVLMLVGCGIQVSRRNFDFNYVDYTRSSYVNRDMYAEEFQKKILGETLYGHMADFSAWLREKVNLPF